MKIFWAGWEKNPTPFSATDTHHLLVSEPFMTFPSFKWVVMLQRYNMPYERQKPLGHIFVIFLQNTKHNTIVDNLGIYDRIESTGY